MLGSNALLLGNNNNNNNNTYIHTYIHLYSAVMQSFRGHSPEIAGFCIYISDFSILCIHILIQLTKERVVLQCNAGFMITFFRLVTVA